MALVATIGGEFSDTYGTLAEAGDYFLARDGAWEGTDEAKEMALRKAATYLDNAYKGRWKGYRVSATQARAWPRSGVIDTDGFSVASDAIPGALKNAQFEAAKLIASGVALETTIERAVKSEKVGSLAVVYSDGASLVAQYPQVTNWLADLVTGSATKGAAFGSVPVVRA